MKRLLAVLSIQALCLFSVRAATPDEIAASIQKGIDWLVSQQAMDGSWGSYEPVAHTAFAVVKLEDRAFELGYSSPFDDSYPYKVNVEKGLDYLFSAAAVGPGVFFSPGRPRNLQHRPGDDGDRRQSRTGSRRYCRPREWLDL